MGLVWDDEDGVDCDSVDGVEGDGYSYANLDNFVQQCNRVACAWLRLENLETLGIGNSRDRLIIVAPLGSPRHRV